MGTDEKLETLVKQLIRETVEGEIKWHLNEPPRALTLGTSDIIDPYYYTKYKGRDIAVFVRKVRGFDPETESTYWYEVMYLAFLSRGDVTFQTSGPNSLTFLVKVAMESAAGLENLLDDLLD